MDPGAAILISGATVSSLLVGFFVWSLKRNVEHEDVAKKKAEAKQEANDKELQKVRDEAKAEMQKVRDETSNSLMALRSELSNAGHKAEMTAHDARTQLAALAGSMGELKGALKGLRDSYEEGRDKQAAFYRTELTKLEQTFRQELSRNVHPDVPERLSKLEALVEALPKKKRA